MEYTHPLNTVTSLRDYIEMTSKTCPRCLRSFKDKASKDWINMFGECLICDHIHNEEIESR